MVIIYAYVGVHYCRRSDEVTNKVIPSYHHFINKCTLLTTFVPTR